MCVVWMDGWVGGCTCACVDGRVAGWVWVWVCVCACMYVCVCAYICVCMYVCVHVRVCVCVSLTCCSLLALVGDLKKSYIVWQEIFDNGLKVWRVSQTLQEQCSPRGTLYRCTCTPVCRSILTLWLRCGRGTQTAVLPSPRPVCRPSTRHAGTSTSSSMDRTGWRLVDLHTTHATHISRWIASVL